MQRRNVIQAGAMVMGMGTSAFAHAQSTALLKPGKPYAGTEISLLTVVAPQFKAHEAKLVEFW